MAVYTRPFNVRLVVPLLAVVALLSLFYAMRTNTSVVCSGALTHRSAGNYLGAKVLISYSYFEKDSIQASNMQFFLEAGMAPHQNVDCVIVVSGEECSPCKGLQMRSVGKAASIGVTKVGALKGFPVLFRHNEGMDFAAHNTTFEYQLLQGKLWTYAFFILLNSSVKGPFYPSYMPATWHWTHAYLERFTSSIHAVGSSLVCLPETDAGGPGPRLESWAVALDAKALKLAVETGVFRVRECKLCADNTGIVVGGEYGLSMTLLKNGLNMATLMSRYARDVDWRQGEHWFCNDNVHPSRHGTYDGIAFHPFETVFVKSSWHVGDPYTTRYAKWTMQHLEGLAGTEGLFNERMYRYAISLQAQEPNQLESAYRVLK